MQNLGMPNREESKKASVDPDAYVGYDKDWYDGSIRSMDSEVGRLIERLRHQSLEDKVQIACIADHGEEFLEHGRMFHGQTTHGELAGVPLMLYRPGVVPQGVRITETPRSIDLMPTLLDLSGLPIPQHVRGQSLVPLLAAARDAKSKDGSGSVGEAAQSRGWKPQPAVTEKAEGVAAGGPPPHDTESYGFVFGGWKLVDNVHRPAGTAEFELCYHAEDPLDRKNVAAQHPEVVERLRAQLAD